MYLRWIEVKNLNFFDIDFDLRFIWSPSTKQDKWVIWNISFDGDNKLSSDHARISKFLERHEALLFFVFSSIKSCLTPLKRSQEYVILRWSGKFACWMWNWLPKICCRASMQHWINDTLQYWFLRFTHGGFFNAVICLLVSAEVEWRTEDYKNGSCRAQVDINKSRKIKTFSSLITPNNNSSPSPPVPSFVF